MADPPNVSYVPQHLLPLSPDPTHTSDFHHSWRNALYVLLLPSCLSLHRTDWCQSGFLPVLYTTISARWRAPSIRLVDESSEDILDGLSDHKFPPERLTGRRILLLWLPALCDLSGTTVRASIAPSTCLELLTYAYVRLGSTAHERWLVVYPCFNLPNDAWSTSAFCWDTFRAVLAPQAVHLPVSYVLLYAALVH